MLLTDAQILDQYKNEHAMVVRATILRTQLRMMADEVFPANRAYGILRNIEAPNVQYR